MKTALAVLLLCSCCFASDRLWTEGTLDKIVSTQSDNGIATIPVGTAIYSIPMHSHGEYYYISTPEKTYVFLLLDARHSLNLTIHGKVKFSVDGQKARILDDEGKEKKVRLTQKIAREQQ